MRDDRWGPATLASLYSLLEIMPLKARGQYFRTEHINIVPDTFHLLVNSTEPVILFVPRVDESNCQDCSIALCVVTEC